MMRLKTVSLMIALGCAATLLSGCAHMRSHQGYLVDNLLVDSIQPGIDNRASVEGTLGRPTFVSQFGPQDWYYVSRDMRQLAFANPKAKEQTVLRVRFDAAGNVERLDKAGIDKVTDISPKDGKTPTLGRERTFFEDIFGNIGAVGAGGAGAGAGGGAGGSGPNGS
jgi:outer membrane protein assembly factor BamE (lipoprotein component of BamABCDE complex)